MNCRWQSGEQTINGEVEKMKDKELNPSCRGPMERAKYVKILYGSYTIH